MRVRKAELLPAALLVFKSIRVGFPSLPVQVWGNHLAHGYEAIIADAARQVGANFANIARTSHDAWIESLILESTNPFWIVDTDVVFWGCIEDGDSRSSSLRAFAGRFEPAFREPYTNCEHVTRLHTAVMYIDPAHTRAAIREFMSRIPEDLRESAQFDLVREHFVPRLAQDTLFYDTMSGLYQAGFGIQFTEEQNDCFDHLSCGSYSDLVSGPLSVVSGEKMSLVEQHRAAYEHPEMLRGLRQHQAKIYERLKVPVRGRGRERGRTEKEVPNGL